MDQLAMLDSFWTANGNAIGGDDFWGIRYAVQVSDDFHTTATGHVLTEVTVGNLMIQGDLPVDARISVYAGNGERPSETAAFTAKASDLGLQLTNERFVDGVFGLEGVISTVSGLAICLVPEQHYYINVQVYSGPNDWAYTVRDKVFTGTDSFLRDGPADEGEGGYGFTDWHSGGEADYGPGDSAYRIEATSGICCLGTEQIARARCRARSRGDVLTVLLTDGFPGDSFDVALSTGQGQSGTLDAGGAARVRFKRLLAGDGTAAATWGCGARDEETYTCP